MTTTSTQRRVDGSRRLLMAGGVAVVAALAIALVFLLQGGDEGLSTEDFVGLWQSNDGVFVQINDDGTLTAAFDADDVASGSLERAAWSLDGSVFIWANRESPDPGCRGLTGTYEVARLTDGAMQFAVIADPCAERLADLGRGPMRPYSP